MDYQQILDQILERVQNLSGAHLWLLISVLVFAVCAVLTMITFRQFNRHQDDFKDDHFSGEPEAILIDTSNSTGITRYTVTEKPMMIGRVEARDSDLYDSIVVPDVTIGRRHAVIEYDAGSFWIQDQGSVNGCFVNGQRVTDRQRLRDGDYIKIHKFDFQFVERFVFAADRINVGSADIELNANTTMPQILSGFESEQSLKPNDVLVNFANRNETILDIPQQKKTVEMDYQRTQVLFREEMHEEFEKLKEATSTGEKIAQPRMKDIQDQTVQLFLSPDDDQTIRLYSEQLDGPPKEQPDFADEHRTQFSQTPLPDIDKKVIAALDDFFSDTQDDLEYAQLEMTDKGDKLSQMGHFSTLPPSGAGKIS